MKLTLATTSDYWTAPECVIYNELVRTSKNYMRCVSAVEERWIKGARPELLRDTARRQQGKGKKRTDAEIKEAKRAAVAERRRRELAARRR